MLAFFPTPYPDELFYSMVARYQQRLSFMTTEEVLIHLFGHAGMKVSHAFPHSLNLFCAKLAKESLFTPDFLIQNHTIFPFFRPFLPKNRAKFVYNKMVGNNKATGINSAVGAAGGLIRMPKYLNFCPSCVKEDRELYDEAYWHRSHQLPGIRVCYKHSVPLVESLIQVLYRQLNTPCYALENIDFNSSKQYKPNCITEFDKYLAISAHWLLESRVPVLGLMELRNRYRSLLVEKNIALTTSSIIQQQKIRQSFIAFYGKYYLHTLGCYPNDVYGNWLARIFTSSHKSTFSPLLHLLTLNLFNVSLNEFFREDYCHFKPFGDPPFPCLNPAASHFRQPVINEVEIAQNPKNGKLLGRFYCSCGFTYNRYGPDPYKKEMLKRTILVSTGHVWDGRLVELVANPALSTNEIARQLGVGPATVKYHLKRISTNEHEEKALMRKIEKDNLKSIYRNVLVELVKINSGATRSQLSELAIKEYSWLTKHDPQWLNSILPERITSIKRRVVDWVKRDDDFCLKAKNAIEELLRETKPVRISIASVENKLEGKHFLQQRLSRLPKTKKLLKEAIETVEDFQIRRVRWWAWHLREEKVNLTRGNLIRKLGLSKGFSERVAEEIQKLIEDLDNCKAS